MNKKTLIALVAFVLLGALFFVGSEKKDKDLIGDGISVYRTTMADKPTSRGYMYVPFTGASERYGVINIALDVNGDGKYEAYDIPSGKQEERIIVNDLPDISGMANRLPFAIIDSDFGSKPMNGIVVISEKNIPEGAWPSEIKAGAVQERTFTISSVTLEARDQNRENDGKGELATGGFSAALGLQTAHAEGVPPPPPNPAQVNAGPYARHDTAYDQDQRYNECGPTAVANSFRMLANTYHLEDRLPADPTDLVDELKGDLRWSDGVRSENMVAGKRAFIERHHLPIEAHQIGSYNDPELLRKIRDEIEKGQAVEGWLLFQNASGTNVGAHVVTITGAGFRDGKNVVTFTDPDTASGNGGGSRDLYRVNPTNYLPTYAPDGIDTFLVLAYAQSPIQSLTDGTWVDPLRDGQAITTGTGAGDTQALPGETRTNGSSKFGFFGVTAPHPGDHYVGESFTYEVAVDKTNIERRRNYLDAAGVEHIWRYGAGTPWVLTGVFRTSGPVGPAEVRDRPNQMSVRGNRATAAERFTCRAVGVATISYALGLSWPRTGGDVPAAILHSAHGNEFNETSDTMTVNSPPFRCMPREGTPPNPTSASVIDSFCPGFTEDQNGRETDVLRNGNECYPTMQFHQAQPDKCDSVHWHANAGMAKSLTGNTWIDPSGCGFGKVNEVPSGKVKLSSDQAVQFLP